MMSTQSKNNSHPVVALPGTNNSMTGNVRNSTGASSTTSRSQTPGRSTRLASLASRPKSPGRAPGSRSRDIVQEVYDRMGVNYVRGQSCIEFDDSKSTISIHSQTKSVTKSPSRSRANARYLYAPPASPGRLSSHSLPGENNKDLSQKQHPVVVIPNDEDGSFPSLKNQKRTSTSTFHAIDTRDDQHDTEQKNVVANTNENRDDRDGDDDGRQSPVSVKSRISAFSAFGKSVTSTRSSRFNKKNDSTGSNKYHPTTSSQRSLKSGVANSFLEAISTSSKNQQQSSTAVVPPPRQNSGRTSSTRSLIRPSDASAKSVPVEIHPTGDSNEHGDDDLSAVSGDDFGACSSKKTHQPSSVVMYGGSNTNRNVNVELTKDMVDRMIEEKLQAQFTQWNESIEKKLRQVENETKSRLDEMEKKLNSLMMMRNDDDGGLKVNTSSSTTTSIMTSNEAKNSPVVRGNSTYVRSFRR